MNSMHNADARYCWLIHGYLVISDTLVRMYDDAYGDRGTNTCCYE